MIYDFHFSRFKHVNGLENQFKKHGIKSYCYAFYNADEIIKYGKANDNEWKNGYWGNRAVRQADAFEGWEMGHRYTTCNSKAQFLKKLIENNRLADKNTIGLIVYDYTEACSSLTRDEADDRLELVEGKLVNTHIDQYERKPILNIARTKGEVAVNTFKNIFDFG